jgi:hypothetical protein
MSLDSHTAEKQRPELCMQPTPAASIKILDVLKFEIHLSHACNLSCESCSHYSNYHLAGTLPLDLAETWYSTWSYRIRPSRITVLGGEPALNQQLCEHLQLLRKWWPHARVWLVSNGLLLRRHPNLPATLAKIGNYRFQISRHHEGPAYSALFADVLKLLEKWREMPGFDYFVKDSFADWTRRYHEKNGKMAPFNDLNAFESWRICPARLCVQLHDGHLWKCPSLAYLPMMKKKEKLGVGWEIALSYRPLSPGCSDQELKDFFCRTVEPYCSICPAQKLPFEKGDPLNYTQGK